MVTVPVYNRTVQDRPAFQQSITTRASGEDFGAAIGRGIQSLGAAGDQAANAVARYRDLEDTTRAKEADNALAEWSRNAMYGDGGYMTLSGRDAVDGRAAFEEGWEQQRKKLSADLSPGAAKLYDAASTARKNQVFESSIVHQANERKAWVKEASASRINTFGDDALANYRDPKKVEFNIAAGQAELRAQADLEGWDADTLAKAEKEYVSGVRKNVALRMAEDDPLAGKAYADRYASQLTGAHQYDLQSGLSTAVKDEEAKAEAARILGIGTPADLSPTGRDEANAAPPIDIEKELAGIKDDDVRDLTRVKINAARTLQASQAEAALKAVKSDAYIHVEQGNSPDTLPLEVKAALGVEGMASLWTYYEKSASGERNVSDAELVYGLNKRAAFDPEGFAKLDLNDYRTKLSPSDFKTLMDLQTAAIKNVGMGSDTAPMKAAFTQADTALESVGITTTGLTGDARTKAAKRIASFQNALTIQVEEFKKANDRNPDDAEVQSMVNKLLLPVVMKKPAWNSFFGGVDTRDGFLFEAGSRADNESVDIAVKYGDIPLDLRDAISTDLEVELARKPSEEEVSARYEAFMLSR